MKSRLLCLLAATGLLTACGRPGNAGDSAYAADPSIQEAAVLPASKPAPVVRGEAVPEVPAKPVPAASVPTVTPAQAPAPVSSPAVVAELPEPDPLVTFEVSPEPPHEVAVEEDYALEAEEVAETPPPQIQPDPHPRPSSTDPSGKEKRLLDLINAARARRHIPPLKFSRTQSKGTGRCMGSAGHAEYMAQRGQISHDNFPRDICLRASASAENVAYASGDESRALESAHRGLMNSPGHYKNLMNRDYNTVGLGFFYYKGRLYVTENFLRL